ncbi:MAG: hypothetical protein ISR65_19910 [Bacteriovoracaceae bacterium]|nr:hypothetical protein [Bacteriovoracaceae bacterium]
MNIKPLFLSNQRFQNKVLYTLLLLLCYLVIFYFLFPHVGPAAIGFVVFLIIYMAISFGIAWGAFLTLLFAPVHILLFSLMGSQSIGFYIGANFFFSHFVFLIIAVTIGHIYQIKYQLLDELLQKSKLEAELKKLIVQQQEALESIELLSGLIPICSYCKKIRNDEGYWEQVEKFIKKQSGAKFSHGICPDCAKKEMPEDF